MATREENNYSRCSICLNDGRTTVARHYCVECETYFCSTCVKCHILPSLKTHQVNDVHCSDSNDADVDTTSLQSDVPSESVPSLRCTLHKGKQIDTFCKEHDEVCCASCAVVKHRSCSTISIAIAAKDFKSSSDMKQMEEALTENMTQCKKEKVKRTDNLDSMSKQKLGLIENVDTYEEKIIAKVKELANISRSEIRSNYEEHKTFLDSDIEALDIVISTSTDCIDTLQQTDSEQLFIYAKNSKTVIKDGELLLKAMMKEWKETVIQFCFDPVLEKHVMGMMSLGRLDDPVTEYKATFQSNVNVKQSNDSDIQIFDLCLIASNDLLVTDYQNKTLKRFNSYLQFKDEIALSGSPCAVCKTDKHEVAVRIRNTKVVHIITIGQSLQLTSSFTLADNGWGMTYDVGTGEILACEDNKVSVYSKTGNKLKMFDKDAHGVQMFTTCIKIALDGNSHHIYITDQSKGLIILDRSGTLKMKVSLSGVSCTWPLCLLPGDICLVGGQISDPIVQVDKDGKQVGNLIGTKDGRPYTYCAVYDREHSRLIVGGWQSVMSVYTLAAKYK